MKWLQLWPIPKAKPAPKPKFVAPTSIERNEEGAQRVHEKLVIAAEAKPLPPPKPKPKPLPVVAQVAKPEPVLDPNNPYSQGWEKLVWDRDANGKRLDTGKWVKATDEEARSR